MRNRALYIGAGKDIIPFIYCDWIDTFECIDSQPESKFGVLKSVRITKYGYDVFSRPNFIPELDKSYEDIGFLLTKIEKQNIRKYVKNGKTIIYHVNTSIPDHYYRVENTFINANTLIVSGHDPDGIFLKYTIHRLDFIGIEGTFFDKDEREENPNSIITRLHRGDIQFFFKKYIFIHKNGDKKEFSLWEDFMKYYYSITFELQIEF